MNRLPFRLNLNLGFSLLLLIGISVIAGCTDGESSTLPPTQVTLAPTKAIPTAIKVTQTPTEVPSTATETPTPRCDTIWPKLQTVEPIQSAPSGEVTITGDGGYLYCNGGYNESARSFELYFDDKVIGSIGCYVNHCQATVNIPAETEPGQHSFSVEGGSTLTLEVIDE